MENLNVNSYQAMLGGVQTHGQEPFKQRQGNHHTLTLDEAHTAVVTTITANDQDMTARDGPEEVLLPTEETISITCEDSSENSLKTGPGTPGLRDGNEACVQVVQLQTNHTYPLCQPSATVAGSNNTITLTVPSSSSGPIGQQNITIGPLASTANNATVQQQSLPIGLSNSVVKVTNKVPVTMLSNPSTYTTTVEQPNNGPSMCFVCGKDLPDPSDRFYYLRTQKLFNTQVTLLELLSDILNQTVITNTSAIDLCSRCSELINETDSAFLHLHRLKKQIYSYFFNNQRPKLTFQVLPKSTTISNINSSNSFPPKLYQPPALNLDDLAATRPRRGRQGKKMEKKIQAFVQESSAHKQESSKIPVVKKKGGRPRKPFGCHICRRKFLNKEMVSSHMVKEHDILPVSLAKPVLGVDQQSPTNNEVDKNSFGALKQEKDKEEDSKNIIIMANSPVKTEGSRHTILKLKRRPILPSPVTSLTNNSSVCSSDPTAPYLANMRPIQPKPQTMVQTAPDGTMVLYMNPTIADAAPAVIKVTPSYMNLKPGPFACEKCNKTFLDEKSRRMHKLAAHGLRKRKRGDEEFEEEEEADKKDERVWPCRQCDATFAHKKELLDHKRVSHSKLNEGSSDEKRERLHACDQCEQMFSYKYELERHRESHVPYTQMGPHEFVCCICGLKVASKTALKIHLHRFHHKYDEPKDYLCSECGYMTSTKKAFTNHQRVHSDDPGPKARCNVCEKEMRASSYKIHMVRMHGEPKHACETCGQRFTVRSDLMRHINTVHSTLRPYDCEICGEKFPTTDSLRYHRNKVHSTVLHYCEFCCKSYKWKGELRTHVQRNHMEHKERLQCNYCSRNYADRRKLRHHMMTKHDVPREMTYFRSLNVREKAPVYKTAMDQLPSGGYEPQGTLIHQNTGPPMHQHHEQSHTQTQLVAHPVYHHQQQHHSDHSSVPTQPQHHHHHLSEGSHLLHSHQTQQHHVYIVPDLNSSS